MTLRRGHKEAFVYTNSPGLDNNSKLANNGLDGETGEAAQLEPTNSNNTPEDENMGHTDADNSGSPELNTEKLVSDVEEKINAINTYMSSLEKKGYNSVILARILLFHHHKGATDDEVERDILTTKIDEMIATLPDEINYIEKSSGTSYDKHELVNYYLELDEALMKVLLKKKLD